MMSHGPLFSVADLRSQTTDGTKAFLHRGWHRANEPHILSPVAHNTRNSTHESDLVELISSINCQMGSLGSTLARIYSVLRPLDFNSCDRRCWMLLSSNKSTLSPPISSCLSSLASPDNPILHEAVPLPFLQTFHVLSSTRN